MEAFCLEISNFLYGEDSEIDRKQINLSIKNLVTKHVGQSDYNQEVAIQLCREITQQCLPLLIDHPKVRHYGYIEPDQMKVLMATVNSVILTDILDAMTWDELRAELNT